ncbi:MAG: hypothetical protein COA58_05530 [Bacteroidetes bacterium]|nr:MAG: hypothetical protein COA58_05530 [Bacteroidota bacterium]
MTNVSLIVNLCHTQQTPSSKCSTNFEFMFQNAFSDALESKKIISLNTYGDNATWIGFVLAYTSEFVTIEHVSKYGQYDGVITLKVTDIERVDLDDEMCRSVNFLYHNTKEFSKLSKTYANLENDMGDFFSVLSECKEKNLICSIDTKELYLSCFVLNIDFEEIHILAIDTHGQKDGECHVKMEDIDYVSVGRLQEIRRLLLYNIHYRS